MAIGAFFGTAATLLPWILGPRKPTRIKLSPYECGKLPIGSARRRFPVKYYLTAMLFVLFDIGVFFLYPWAVVFRQLKLFGLVEMAIFVLTIAVGYVYVWRKGAFEWD